MKRKKRETIVSLQTLVRYLLEDTIRKNKLLPVVLHGLSDEKPFTIGTEDTSHLKELAETFSQALSQTDAYLYAATLPMTVEGHPFALVWIESRRSARGCLLPLLFDEAEAFIGLGDPLPLDEVPEGNPFVGLLRKKT